jgi:hypothetical protein
MKTKKTEKDLEMEFLGTDPNAVTKKLRKATGSVEQYKAPKKEIKIVADVKRNWNTLTFACSNLFYLTLGTSLMLTAGFSFWVTYEVAVYAPLEIAIKFASVLVGLTAFVPMAKGLARR